ncbi:MAG: hypothetical protein HY711_01110 [Candidatus Melainabacteria bacterium]|nr:hypothetical protein [Candidatus Melainabacteria bacterium]
MFMISMAQVVLSANALTFLVFWELMSLSSAALVACDPSNKQAPRAALIYLGATRIATSALAGAFLWLYSLTASWDFSAWTMSTPAFAGPACLVFFGLAIKAGVWPFHLWLPYAHPAAPSPVSALMSGVMIKVAIYALIRLIVFGGTDFETLAYVVCFLGTVSTFWGVLFALIQHDLKRLLAYHSIENIGLIVMGIGLCLYGMHTHLPGLVAVGLAAAIFHSVNHGLFKSLLFLGAGAVDCQVGTRDLGHLGGLVGKMPWTAACFLIGSAAICSLPPLNGFASKWLLYQGLFTASDSTTPLIARATAMACIGILALVGGLAVACFTKAYGVTFLGRARTHASAKAPEASRGMIAGQVLLAACCCVLGLAVAQVLQVLEPLCNRVMSSQVNLATVYILPQWAFAVILALSVALFYFFILHRQPTRATITWECGYGELPARSQVTAASFAQPIEQIFAPVLQYETALQIAGADRRHFPDKVKVEEKATSFLESRVYGPIIWLIDWVARRFTKIQTGSIHFYLLYMLATLVVLMFIGTKL